MSLRAAPWLYKRSYSPGERLQMAMTHLGERRASTGLAATIARVALDYVHDRREALAHAIDVAVYWARSQADDEGLRAERRRAAEVASLADEGDDRCAWTCIQAALTLFDVALEPIHEIAAKRARDLAGFVLEAMCWPDVADDSLRAAATERLHDALDDEFDHTQAPRSAASARSR